MTSILQAKPKRWIRRQIAVCQAVRVNPFPFLPCVHAQPRSQPGSPLPEPAGSDRPVPLYLAKHSRHVKEDMRADLIDRIESECAQLYNYLKRLHGAYRVDINTYVRLVSLSEAAIKHYAAKSPSLEGALIKYMESMFVGTEITRALDANFQEGEASGFRKGETSGFRKGETSGFQKGEASGFQKGEASGLQKGKASALRDVFSGMMRHGYSIAEISEMTGVPVDEIMNVF